MEDYAEVHIYLGLDTFVTHPQNYYKVRSVKKRTKDKVYEMLNIAYKTIIQPHIDYCITVCGYASDVYMYR